MIALLTIPVNYYWNDLDILAQVRMNSTISMVYKVVIIGMVIFPLIRAYIAWLQVHCRSYKITTQRFSETYGIFNKVTEDLELYRVKDITTLKPFTLRMFNLGNIVLMTSDKSTPIVIVEGMSNVDDLQSTIRKHVEIMRTHKGVREID